MAQIKRCNLRFGGSRIAQEIAYERTENFASPGGALLRKRHVYAAPVQLKLNHWALSGDWTVEKQLTVLNKPNGRIAYRFHARDLHLVMGPAVRGASVRFRVLIDGQAPRAAHGIDVDEQGNGTITEPRLYQLIRQRTSIADRQFEIEFLNTGVQAFARRFRNSGSVAEFTHTTASNGLPTGQRPLGRPTFFGELLEMQ